MDDLATLTRRLRKERGWSQTDLANLLGKSQRWVSDVETGTIPRPAMLRALADALRVDRGLLIVAADLTRRSEHVEQLADDGDTPEAARLRELHRRFDPLLLNADPRDLDAAAYILSRGQAVDANADPAAAPAPPRSVPQPLPDDTEGGK